MKLLWLSNFCFSENSSSGSGTWIEAMGHALSSDRRFEITNICLSGTNRVIQKKVGLITQWELPIRKVGKDGMPPKWMIRAIQEIERTVSPDLIHIWGTEVFWGLLTARKLLKTPALLEMQGLPGAMVPYVGGCLTHEEQHACVRFKEWLKPISSIFHVQKRYDEWREIEAEIISGHQYIDYESDWVKAYIGSYATQAHLFRNRMILRKDFLEAVPWRSNSQDYTIFSCCGFSPNKGMHTLIRSVRVIRRIYPRVKLILSGTLTSGLKTSGYQKFIAKLIKDLNLKDVVMFVGDLNSKQMVERLQKSSVVVVPSFVESYSMSLAEAMAVGCPVVCSYAGAMPEVGGDAVRYFPIADFGALAGEIMRFIDDREMANAYGAKALIRSRKMHQIDAGIERQIEVYETIRRSLDEKDI